jgi:hypothetical protein
LAKVRSAISVTIALVLLLVAPSAAAAGNVTRVHLLVLPPQTTVGELAAAGFSPGVMSPGLGTVPAAQTYLDVGQGNRVFDSLYDEELPPLKFSTAFGRGCDTWGEAVRSRAESAPAEIVPFLLFDQLQRHEVAVFRAGGIGCPFGGVGGQEGTDRNLLVHRAPLVAAERVGESLRGRDLLIAFARPRGDSHDSLPIGIAGRGFDGDLTSDSTRMNGYVLSTDLAPTILSRFGIAVPSEMSGQPIRAEGKADPPALEALAARMGEISSRRGPVIALPIAVWLLLTLAVAIVAGRARTRSAVRLLGLSLVYLPLMLLLGAALEPGQAAEALQVGLGAPVLGAATLAVLGGYRSLAAASALTVLAYAIDVIAGSPLTALSLLGPNPGLGVRFYGIGNELEALLAVLVVAGCGAALTGFAPRATRPTAAAFFVFVGLLAAVIFAAGRFGADVGAAIVFPVGAAVAAVAVGGRSRRSGLLFVFAAPFLVLALLALVDLVSGANAHLTRSVLDAGGLGDLAEVAQRRLQLSAHSFGRPVLLAFLPVVLALAILAYLRRDRLHGWVAEVPAMRAGLLGALAATAIGTIANDSGALLLEIGAAYLLVFTGYAWAEKNGSSG